MEAGGDTISATIGGPVSGQVAVGKGITQTQTVGAPVGPPTAEELDALRAAVAELRSRIAAAPALADETKASAAERVDELEAAATAAEPNLSTLEYVRNWFAKHVPAFLGAVTGIVVHPVVGKLVHAAGDAVAAEFEHRFG
jgi:septal ring factor EnvC (AmiA/AmiB activator)